MHDAPEYHEINNRALRLSSVFIIILFCLASRSGAQWTKIGNNVFFGPGSTENSGALGFKDGTLCGGTHNIMISFDTGRTWTTSYTLTASTKVNSVDFLDANTIVVKTD